jgi:protein-disulfide isomerase
MKKVFWLLVAVMVVPPLWALDKSALELHLRKTLNLDTRTEIKVTGDPAPSGLGNMLVIPVTVGGAPYPVFMSPDEKQYVWGFAADMKVDPDQARAALLNPKTGHARGSASAPITVVEFSDLQCGHCKHAHEEISKNLFKTYKQEQVRFVFKHFPLSGHDWAEPAAVAAECAAEQRESTFWNVVDYFFANQESVKKDNVKAKSLEAVKGLNLNAAAFEKCLSGTAAAERVRNNKQEGTAAGVGSTPTIYINGRQRRGFRDFEDIKVVIEEKLQAKK